MHAIFCMYLSLQEGEDYLHILTIRELYLSPETFCNANDSKSQKFRASKVHQHGGSSFPRKILNALSSGEKILYINQAKLRHNLTSQYN